MKIAVDAMGGDDAPLINVEGVAEALEAFQDVEIQFVGHIQKLTPLLKEHGILNHPRLILVHAEQAVAMGEPSTVAIRSKKDSSITVAASLVAKGESDALVSAGHTGAAVTATTVRMRTLPGIERPAIATIMPSPKGSFILIDAGANTDCQPIHLAQFAIMGEAFSHHLLGTQRPRIGLLSVGTEDRKGNKLTKETFEKLSQMPINFIGNIEGNDLFEKKADVVVCDGFVGNALLKSCESMASAISRWMEQAFKKNYIRLAGALLVKEAFREFKAIVDSEEYGGAPLLGVNGICIICHGKSKARGIKNAVRIAREFVKCRMNSHITKKLSEAGILLK